jgi:carboxymethylenebutenolidase
MCFDLNSRPPIVPIAGGALDASELTLDAADSVRIRAFRARATAPLGAGILVLPDVRGLHPYYEELALRFAENGVDALAIDYFARTAGTDDRGDDFEFMRRQQAHLGRSRGRRPSRRRASADAQ